VGTNPSSVYDLFALSVGMKGFCIHLSITLCLFIGSPIVGALQTKKSNEKSQPPVTLEMMRKLSLEIDEKVRVARESGNKLTELNVLRSLEPEYAAKGIAAHMTIAMRILTLAPELGDYREALRCGDVGFDLQSVPIPSNREMIRGYRPQRATPALVRAAASSQVVMINEAHHVPQHRAFTLSLLKGFKEIGFTHLATETLYEGDSTLNERGYPTKETGFYTQEPVYGDLIRTAIKLGYMVIAYEPTNAKTQDEREVGQAKNLVERILKGNPKARILIHAGYSHIEESGSLVGAVTMAQRFKEMTGIDPLTIDQTKMTEHSAPQYEQALYRHVTNRKQVLQPTVYLNRKGEMWSLAKSTWDVTLFHPRSRYHNGRPDWLRLTGSRRPYPLSRTVCGNASQCLVVARLEKEGPDAVPIDQVEVVRGRTLPPLLLPPGKFEIKIESAFGKVINRWKVRLEKT
jgi:hypothetical protein